MNVVRDETIAIHGGYEGESTRAVAVPIYQTVAHEFIDADHAAALFDLEAAGFHYNRINNPTVDVLEKRMTALEGGAAGLALASGTAAVRYAVRNVTATGANVVCAPQLYGATYTLFAHILPEEGVEVRFAVDDKPQSLEARIDNRTAAVFCESIGNPAGNIVDLPAVCDMAHSQGVPVIVDNTVATPDPPEAFRTRGRRRGPLADQVRGRPRDHPGRAHRRRGVISVGRRTGAISDVLPT